MAARVVEDQLKQIIQVSGSVQMYIDTAHTFVNEHVANLHTNDELVEKIELYLAAHFAAITEERGGLIQSEAMDALERYADVYEGGLRSTRYGQQAIVLDTSGKLADLAQTKMKAQFRVV